MLYGTIFNISEIVYRYHARNPVDERGAQTIAVRTLFFFKGGFFFYFLWLRTINCKYVRQAFKHVFGKVFREKPIRSIAKKKKQALYAGRVGTINFYELRPRRTLLKEIISFVRHHHHHSLLCIELKKKKKRFIRTFNVRAYRVI